MGRKLLYHNVISILTGTSRVAIQALIIYPGYEIKAIIVQYKHACSLPYIYYRSDNCYVGEGEVVGELIQD